MIGDLDDEKRICTNVKDCPESVFYKTIPYV